VLLFGAIVDRERTTLGAGNDGAEQGDRERRDNDAK
jgi:hypothetical protein